MDKNEEFQKWLRNDMYIQRKELEILWNIGKVRVGSFLNRNKIKPLKSFHVGKQGNFFFYDRRKCENARLCMQQKRAELDNCKTNKMLVTLLELAQLWTISLNAASSSVCRYGIKPTKKLKIGEGYSARSFYDRAECERARPFINQPKTKKEVEKVENTGELATATKNQILNEAGADNFVWDKVTMKHKIMPVKNYCDERGNFISLFKKDETVSAILAYKNEQKQLLEKCLADENLVTTKQLVNLWNMDKIAVYNNIYRLKIKPYAKIKLENGSLWCFYKKSDCMGSQEVEKVEQVNLPEPKEQSPDIIHADTIDLFTMSELESELKQRGVELTAEVKAKINASDMHEMQHIATMIRGNAKTIAIRLSVLNEIAKNLRQFVEILSKPLMPLIDKDVIKTTSLNNDGNYTDDMQLAMLKKPDHKKLKELGYLTSAMIADMIGMSSDWVLINAPNPDRTMAYGSQNYARLWKEETIADWLKIRGEHKIKEDIKNQISKIEKELFNLKIMLIGLKE